MSNFKSKLTVFAASLAVVMASYTSTVSAATVETFGGLGMMLEAWEIEFNGNVNSFVVTGDCDPDEVKATVAHGLACGSDGVDQDYGDIRTGLLPSWFDFIAATKAPGGWKTKIHISFQPGGDSGNGLNGGGIDSALGLNTSNFRQIYTSLGHDDYGTFKIGRDLGVFGSNAILEDQTLLGVGAPGGIGGGNTTLGRIGFGYIYADWKAQLQYITPTVNGLSATFALVDPWAASSLGGDSTTNLNRAQEGDTYGFEAKVNWAFDAGDGISGHVWASYATQDVDWKAACRSDHTYNEANSTCSYGTEGGTYSSSSDAEVDAYDIGGKLVFGDFDFVAYYYDGEGIGTTSFLIDGIDPTGEERDSDGFYYQARWRTPVGTLLGASYGKSELDDTDWDSARGVDNNLVEENELFVIGAYHPVGEGLNLVVEYSQVESEAHNGNGAEEDVFAFGAIMFF